MPEQPLKLAESSFAGHAFSAEIGEAKFSFRVLKMINSVLIYIGDENNEIIDEMAVAMPTRNNEVIGTTALGAILGCESQELALKIATKLRKQVYISCNVPVERMIRPLLEKRLFEEIKEHPEYFT